MVLLHFLVLFGMWGRKQYTVSSGTQVVLECRPVDPRSLFRGDYVILNYAINRLPGRLVRFARRLPARSPVYVKLAKSGEVWRPLSVHAAAPDLGRGEVFVKGRLRHAYRPVGPASRRSRRSYPVRIRYNFGKFFVPEGKGKKIELARNRRKLTAVVAVDRFGSAVPRYIMIDGRRVQYDW